MGWDGRREGGEKKGRESRWIPSQVTFKSLPEEITLFLPRQVPLGAVNENTPASHGGLKEKSSRRFLPLFNSSLNPPVRTSFKCISSPSSEFYL
jgi:hypothetical protein